MNTFTSLWHSSNENYNTTDIYSRFDPFSLQLQEDKPILSPPHFGLFNERIGIFDNPEDSELINEFGKVHEEARHETVLGGSVQPFTEDPILHLNSTEQVDFSVKKLSHNAHERQRRKKLNALYSRLRSLLPHPVPKGKLSIPNTVAGALKYIPELQKEFKNLSRQRDQLLSIKRISHRRSVVTSKSMHSHSYSDGDDQCSSPVVTLNSAALRRLEAVMTVYTCRAAFQLSSLLVMLEEGGLEVVNSSTFFSGDKLWHILQLQMKENSTLDLEVLQRKVILF